MEQQLRDKCEHTLNQTTTNVSGNSPSVLALCLARSLLANPFTSAHIASSIFETLLRSLQTDHNPISVHHTLYLLSDSAARRPHLSRLIFDAVRSFSLLCKDNSARTVAESLSVLVSTAETDQTLVPALAEFSEGLFVSLCFRSCVSIRHWLLLNAERFHVRPYLLLTLLLGFTKDPYPYVRRVALDGLVDLCNSIVVEDHALIEGCYCRAVELLRDMEDCVRCAAIRAVSEWGKLLVASNQASDKRDRSDALFVQLSSVSRDMSLDVRVTAFDAIGQLRMVSEDILLQTLSKKVLAVTKKRKYHGQCSTKQFEIPASSAAGVFIHGLEDEFYEVRNSACKSLRALAILSTDFAGEALNILVDVLNDDSVVVRLQALETMHHMAMLDLLKLQEMHMHMFLGTLVDMSTLVRCAARRILQLTKLDSMAIFRLSVYGLLENLEMYPQDEVDVFSVLFKIGKSHGNFAVNMIDEVSNEIEPSGEGKLGFDSARVAALLVLAISAPLSHGQSSCSIPPKIFSYAVTMLGRISRALCGVTSQNTLLAYLSHCSRSTVISDVGLYFKMEEPFLAAEGGKRNNTIAEIVSPDGMPLQQVSGGASGILSQKTWEPRNLATSPVDYQLECHEETQSAKLILAKIKDIWQLIQFGCTDQVLKMLRSWKEMLATFTADLPTGLVNFTLQYIRVMKQLAKVWVHVISPRKLRCYKMGDLGLNLGRLGTNLGELRYKFIGFSNEEELHVLELILLYCILKLSSVEACCNLAALKKLHSTISRVEFLHEEGSVVLSDFVIEIKKSLREIGTPTDGPSHDPLLFRKLVEFFSLKQLTFTGKLDYINAEVNIHGNDFENPFPFISGLPIGIPLEITLYNISRESRLWLRITLYEGLNEFVFLDLNQFVGCDKIRKYTFVAPFYKTPKANSFTLRVCIGLECLTEDILSRGPGGPKHELTYLCKEKEVYLSVVDRK